MRESAWVWGWVVAFVLGAVLFSGIVAMGPPLGSGGLEKAAKGKQTQSKQPATERESEGRTVAKENEQRAKKETECTSEGQSSYYDCLIQLRTARATERQAYYAKVGAWIAGFALLAAAAAASAGLWTVWVMRNSAERQLRAYVVLHDASVSFTDNNFALVQVRMRNTGQTPARDFTAMASVVVVPFPPPAAVFRHRERPEWRKPSVSTLGGQGSTTIPLPSPEPVPIAIKEGIRSGEIALYAFGKVTYKDVFGRSQATEFRVMCGGPTKIVEGHMANCDQGNSAT